MKLLKKSGCFLLMIVLLREISLPFFMGFFSSAAGGKTFLLSQLGQAGNPLHAAFKRWEIIDGCLFILSAPYFYDRFKNQFRTAGYLFGSLIAIYGIGDCLMTAFFVYHHNYFSNWSSFLHAAGSAIGSLALFVLNFGLLYLAAKTKQTRKVHFIGNCLLLSSLAVILMESRLFDNDLLIGIFQCLYLDFLYLPVSLLALNDSLRLVKKLLKHF